MKQRSAWLLCFLLFFAGILGGCKPKELSEETDWREQYNSTATPEVTDTPKKEDPSGTPSAGKFPTPILVPEFVPKPEQTELVLYLSNASADLFDEYMQAALNRLLQERGYSFYVTRRTTDVLEYWDQISHGYLNEWQELLDAGEKVDLVYLDGYSDTDTSYELFGGLSFIRAIQEGYLLPFSQYPETDAKRRLLSAYPESYWELSSFRGEIYGIYGSVSDLVKCREYIMFNLDAAEQAGIEAPEQLEMTNLDALLQQAEDAGIPGMDSFYVSTYSRIYSLVCGLYLKYEQDGTYRIVNPTEDSEFEEAWDADRRYDKNGWVWLMSDAMSQGKLPLIIWTERDDIDGNGGVVSFNSRAEVGGKPVQVKVSARVKIYGEDPRVFIEGIGRELLGISAASQCKEEAVELLSLMHTDEEVVKLLRYGVEGVHYRVDEEGKPENIKSGRYSLANRIMHLEFEETLGKTNRESDYYEGIARIIKIPYLDDFTEEQKERLKKIRKISVYNINQTMDEKRAALAEAGYDELAREINEAHGWK